MINLIAVLAFLLVLIVIQIAPQSLYYFRMKLFSKKSWNIKIDPSFRPKVTIVVPTYQEADIVKTKLHNLNSLIYPEDKLEVIIVDSASTDGTLEICKNWLPNNAFKFKILLLSEPKRVSKAHALNYALKHSEGEVIVTSDADAILAPDILLKAVPYLADPSVGAVSGREIVRNKDECFLARMENTYRDIYYALRLGESKIHSTQIFQGEFAAYKREFLHSFIDEPGRADDNGTVTEFLKEGKRCLFIQEAVFQDALPCSLQDYLNIKIRRAHQLQREFLIRLKLWCKRKMKVPVEVLISNIYQHCVVPLFFAFSIPLTILVMVGLCQLAPFYLIAIILCASTVIYKLRYVVALYFIGNITLLAALSTLIFGRRISAWKAIRSSRKNSFQL